jgi:uncharacterized heparinase superfamily protein
MSFLRTPWRDLSDAALLAHFRGDRGVRFEPVIDTDECHPERLAGVIAGRFEFNGEAHALHDPIDWLTNPSRDVEWHILLHKFYYAVGLAQRWQRDGDARALRRWTQLIDGWIAQTPPGFIAADVTGRRVQNWIYSLHAILPTAPLDPGVLRRLLHSLHTQVEFLCANLTPKRNHRTLELLAIFLAGVVFPEFERAAAWRERALHETLANVRADLLPDGVHCELSTDYHHLAVRNWLQVRRLASDNGYGVPREFDRALEAALEFSLHVHQPSGLIPSFSDGDVRSFLPLLAQGAQLFDRGDMQYVASGGTQGTPPRERVAHFPNGGYHVLRSDWASADAQHLVFDCGPLGEGNHGHFDALSFELAAFGRALVVDPGRYTYSESGEDKNWRVHFRSTAAHNTVCIDGLNQTRYLPRPIKEASRHAPGSIRHKISGPPPQTTLQEAHSGTRLDLLHGRCASHEYDAVHERCIVFVDRRYWIVSDWLRAPGEHDYLLNFQLAAPKALHWRSDDCGTLLQSSGLSIAQPHRSGQRSQIGEGWISQRYGHRQAALALRTHMRSRDANFDSVLLPWRDATPPLQVSTLPTINAQGEQGQALRIDNGDVIDGWFHARSSEAPSPWQIGERVFTGRWLHWREDAHGQLLRAVSHAGASLHTADGAWPLEPP